MDAGDGRLRQQRKNHEGGGIKWSEMKAVSSNLPVLGINFVSSFMEVLCGDLEKLGALKKTVRQFRKTC